jgi:CBS domain-containing protein
MNVFTGEKDIPSLPETENILDWWLFNSDMYSTERSSSEVEEIMLTNIERLVDLRPYMIEEPYIVYSTDKLDKCLELFRNMHLRALPVIDPNNGSCVYMLTREDLFAYMSL